MSIQSSNQETKQISIGLYFLLVLIGLCISLFVLLHFSQQKLVALGEIRYQSNLLADQLRQSSDDLTRLVRTYAVTSDGKFEQQFWEVLAIRNGEKARPLHYDRIYWDFLAVENAQPPYPLGKAASLAELMKEVGFTERELTLLAKAQENSDQLVALEQIAMDAMRGKIRNIPGRASNEIPNQQMAIDILFGDGYHEAKAKIMEPINTFLEELDRRTHEEVNREAFHLQLFLFTQILTFAATISIVILLMRTAKKYHTSMVDLLSSTVRERTAELERSNDDLKQEIEEREKAEQKIRVLKGLLPICSSCKNIRDDRGYWNQIEIYIHEHSEAKFTHGICPDCAKKLYPEFYEEIVETA